MAGSATNPNAQRKVEGRLLVNLTLLWSGQVLAKVLTFFAFAYLARVLSPDAYGTVEFAIGLGAFASLVIDAGIGVISVRRTIANPDERPRLAKLTPTLQLAIAAILAPLIVLFASQVAKLTGAALALASLVALSTLILPFKQEWLFQSLERMGDIALSQALRAGLFLAAAVVLVGDDAGLVRVGLVELCALGGATLYLSVVQHRRIAPLGLTVNVGELGGLAREGFQVGLVAILWALAQYLPLLLVGVMMGMKATGFFGASHRLAMALATFTFIYHFNLYPRLARGMSGERGALRALTSASIRLCAWGGVGLALGVTLWARPILVLLFGAKFASAAPVLGVLIWTFPITLLAGHVRWLLVAAHGERQVMLSQLAGVLVIACAGPVLILQWGEIGAAASMTLSCLGVWLINEIFGRRAIGPTPLRSVAMPAISAVAILAFVKIMGLEPFAAGLAGLTAFALAMMVFDRKVFSDLKMLGRTGGHSIEPTEVYS